MAWRFGLARPPTQLSGWFASGVAEHLRASHHALPELLRERGQRSLVNTQCSQAIPGERHGHPAPFLLHRSTDLRGRLNLLPDRRQPRPCARRISKRQEFVSPRQRWHSHQQDVLNVIKFKHDIYSGVAAEVLVRTCRRCRAISRINENRRHHLNVRLVEFVHATAHCVHRVFHAQPISGPANE